MSGVGDDWDLDRFVTAQDVGGTYDRALAELRAGRKTSHWMWFVFPQLRGLGHSETARRYGLASLDEAAAYDAHPVLGPRLRECVDVVASLPETSAEAVLGGIDAMKLHACATLFLDVVSDRAALTRVIDRWYGGQLHSETLALLVRPTG